MSAVELKEVKLFVFLMKPIVLVKCKCTITFASFLYFIFYFIFNKFVYVFNLNPFAIPSINNWLAKSNWLLLIRFYWSSSDVTMVILVASWISDPSWLSLFVSFVIFLSLTRFFYERKIYKKMILKNPKTLRKYEENIQPQKPKLKFLKTLIFPRTPQKIQNWVNLSFFPI